MASSSSTGLMPEPSNAWQTVTSKRSPKKTREASSCSTPTQRAKHPERVARDSPSGHHQASPLRRPPVSTTVNHSAQSGGPRTSGTRIAATASPHSGGRPAFPLGLHNAAANFQTLMATQLQRQPPVDLEDHAPSGPTARKTHAPSSQGAPLVDDDVYNAP